MEIGRRIVVQGRGLWEVGRVALVLHCFMAASCSKVQHVTDTVSAQDERSKEVVFRRSRGPILSTRTERSFGVGTDEGTALDWTCAAANRLHQQTPEVPLPAEPKTVMRDGPLLTLGTFLNCGPFSIGETGEMDKDVSFMVNTTVKYLVEGGRASEASLSTQKQSSGMIYSSRSYDL
jgi:hypothetical protein